MALLDPCLFLQADAHPARSFRAVITEMWDEGVRGLSQLKVSERNAGAGGPNFSVDISVGRGVVKGDSATLQGNYMCTNDAVTNVTVTSAPSAGNTRYDIVILEVKDNSEDAGGLNLPRFRVVAGTPASSGAVPPAVPVSSILLATIGPIVNATTTIANSLITDGRTLAGRTAAPGTIEHLAGTRVPNGWLACDGTAVSRTTYADLFAEVGTSFGVGNGSTTFNLPDLRGRVATPVKSGQSQVDAIGETGGEYTHTMTTGELVAHNHGGTSGTESDYHTHAVDPAAVTVRALGQNVAVGNTTGAGAGPYYGLSLGGGDTLTADVPSTATGNQNIGHTHSIPSQGSTSAFNVMSPYQVVGLAVIRT